MDRRVELSDCLLEAYERLLELDAQRQRAPTEAPPALTFRFVRYVFAVGFAWLGELELAERFRQEARAGIADDAIAQILGRFFEQRIDDARAGRAAHALVPVDLSTAFVSLEQFHRYKVARLLGVSQVCRGIEPTLNAVTSFHERRVLGSYRGLSTRELDELVVAELPEADVAALATEISRSARPTGVSFDVLDRLTSLTTDSRIHCIDAVLGSCGDRAVQEEAVAQALGFMRVEIPRRRAGRNEIVTLDGEQWAHACPHWVERLQQAGSSDLAVELTGELLELSKRFRSTAGARATTYTAAAAAVIAVDGYDSVETSVDPDEEFVEDGLLAMRADHRMYTLSHMLHGFSYAPPETAHRHVMRLLGNVFPHITDSWNTNSHFCLTVLSFAEAVVVAYARSSMLTTTLAAR